MKTSQRKGLSQISVWGSGLLAVDVVMRSGESEPFEITAGGTCANVLSNLAHFGWNACARGRVGADAAGQVLAEHLKDAGVDASSIVFDEQVETPLIVERFGLGNPAMPTHRFEWNCPKCGTRVPRFRATPIPILALGDSPRALPDVFFFDRPTPGNLRLARALKALGVTIMFEPPRLKREPNFELGVRLADIVKIAECDDILTFEAWLHTNSLAVITYGQEGLSYRAANFRGVSTDWTTLPAYKLSSTLDSCGSGDWLSTGLLHAFFAVNDLTEDVAGRLSGALKYGQALAALNCLLPGARGLARVFDHAEISDMVALALAKGPTAVEGRIGSRSNESGRLRDLESVCNACHGLRAG